MRNGPKNWGSVERCLIEKKIGRWVGRMCCHQMYPRNASNLMRKSFATAVHDPELIPEANKMKLDMKYRPPDALERSVAKLYETTANVIEAVKKLVCNREYPMRAGAWTNWFR